MSEEWYDAQFYFRKTDPTLWWITALELQKAAEKIWDEYQGFFEKFKADPEAFYDKERRDGLLDVTLGLHRPYFLLMSLAIENLAKGVLIGRNPEKFKSEGFSHNVSGYIRECGIDLTEEQSHLVNQIEHVIKWRGRYPIPTRIKDWSLNRRKDGRKFMPGTITYDDKDEVQKIFILLNNTLAQERKKSKK